MEKEPTPDERIDQKLRDADGLTPREATTAAGKLLVLMEQDFVAGIRELEMASPLTWRIVHSYFEKPFGDADRVFNPRLVARVERLGQKFDEYIRSRAHVEHNQG